ncbi:MAG: rhomboid family intramembrane serine protease [Gemmatimonadetes bacterium]|nr:rhomboid family intramembrane serine protease [Gemmatimonadota bacterium]
MVKEDGRTARLTPWVTRLIVFNGVVWVLLATVFTAPRFFAALQFDPEGFSARPWTALTYIFVHDNIFHLALSSLVLSLFGSPVERRLGGARFLASYLYCGVGAALLALGLAALVRVDPFSGSAGATFGVGLGCVLLWPAAEIRAVPIKAGSLFCGLIALDIAVGLAGTGGVAHLAHLGGALAGYVFFRLQTRASRQPTARPIPMARRPVVTPMRMREAASEREPTAPADHRRHEAKEEEVNQVLDKIAQLGIDSLTFQERKVLGDASERKRREQH